MINTSQSKNILNIKAVGVFLLSVIYIPLTSIQIRAQEIAPPTIRPPQSQPRELETLPTLKEILPELPDRTAPDDSDLIRDFANTVFIKKFEIVGSTVFTPEELAKVLKPYTLRRLAFTEILSAQQANRSPLCRSGLYYVGNVCTSPKVRRRYDHHRSH